MLSAPLRQTWRYPPPVSVGAERCAAEASSVKALPSGPVVSWVITSAVSSSTV